MSDNPYQPPRAEPDPLPDPEAAPARGGAIGVRWFALWFGRVSCAAAALSVVTVLGSLWVVLTIPDEMMRGVRASPEYRAYLATRFAALPALVGWELALARAFFRRKGWAAQAQAFVSTGVALWMAVRLLDSLLSLRLDLAEPEEFGDDLWRDVAVFAGCLLSVCAHAALAAWLLRTGDHWRRADDPAPAPARGRFGVLDWLGAAAAGVVLGGTQQSAVTALVWAVFRRLALRPGGVDGG